MSRDFPGSYGNYLSGSLSVSAAPITMACWFRSDTSVLSNQSLMCVGDAGDMLTMRIRDPADNDLIALAYDGSQGFATSGTTWTTNTWHHACAVFASTTSRTSYLDGSGGSANTTSISPTISPSTLYVGRDSRSTQFPMNGEVAWPCVWNVALTAGEVAALAAGAHPLTIRPESIIGFWGPLLGTGTSPALVGNDLIETGAASLGAGDVQLALGGAWYVNHTSAAAGGDTRITHTGGDTRVTHTGGDTRVTADTGGTALVVADATHAQSADSLALSQAHTLAAQDATHAHSADNLTLTQTHGLAVADATHSHTADSLTLVPQGSLSVQDATHSHTADSLALTQTHALAVADATHAHAADNVGLTENTDLVVQGANHAHSADSVALTQTHNLNVADSTHSHTADALTLVVTSAALNISDATHGHTADVVDFSGDVPAGGKGSSKAKRYPRRVMIEGRVSVVSNPREERQLLKQYRQALEARKAAAEGKGNEIAAKRASVAIKRTETRIDNTFDYAAAWDAYLQAEDEELLLLLYG